MGGVTLNASVTAKSAVLFFSFPLFPASPQAPLRSFTPAVLRSAISRDLSDYPERDCLQSIVLASPQVALAIKNQDYDLDNYTRK